MSRGGPVGAATRQRVAAAIDAAITAHSSARPSARDILDSALEELPGSSGDTRGPWVGRSASFDAMLEEAQSRWPEDFEATLLEFVDGMISEQAALDRFATWSDRPWGTTGPEWTDIGADITEIGVEWSGGLSPLASSDLVFRPGGASRTEVYHGGSPETEHASFDLSAFEDLARAAAALYAPREHPRDRASETVVFDAGETYVWLHRARRRVPWQGSALGPSLVKLLSEAADGLDWKPASELPLRWDTGRPVTGVDGGTVDCPMCRQGILTARYGRFGEFVGCSRYPECSYVKKDGPPPPDQLAFEVRCPKNDDGHLVARRVRRTGNVFWGCSAYPKCDFTTSGEPTGAIHDAHEGGLGAVARHGGDGTCMTCGAAVELPSTVSPGLRLPGGPPDPAALSRLRRSKKR